MKFHTTVFAFIAICLTVHVHAQYEEQYNNFDTEGTLEIILDSLGSDTIWQIGAPQKTILMETSSAPNALITDTLNTYPTNTNASFVVEVNDFSMDFFPYIQLEWFQKTDFEDGVDGGIIEVSYDRGETWRNIFTDTVYRPEVVGTYQWDTLHNEVAGVTGTTDLSWMAICWGTSIGTQPNIIDPVQVRFTMTTDSTDTNQDGWLIDNFFVRVLVVGSTADRTNFKELSVSPNPTIDEIKLNLPDVLNEEVDVFVYDSSGKMVYSERTEMYGVSSHIVDVSNCETGMYYVIVKGEEVRYQQKFMKIK